MLFCSLDHKEKKKKEYKQSSLDRSTSHLNKLYKRLHKVTKSGFPVGWLLFRHGHHFQVGMFVCMCVDTGERDAQQDEVDSHWGEEQHLFYIAYVKSETQCNCWLTRDIIYVQGN